MLLALAVDRTPDERRPNSPERPRPARSVEDGPFGRDQLAVVAALEDLLVRADDLDVGIPGTPPAPCLPDFEMRIDPLFDHAQAVRG